MRSTVTDQCRFESCLVCHFLMNIKDSTTTWEDWSKEDLEQEIKNRLAYFYNTSDGMKYPNNVEGDILKIVYTYIYR